MTTTTQATTPATCRGCGKALSKDNEWMCDGCPCNSPRGINHGIVPAHVCTCEECERQTGQAHRRTVPPEHPIKFREFI